MSLQDREYVKDHPFNQRKVNKGGTRRHGDVRAIEHAKRVARLRRATAKARQLLLFPSRWTRIQGVAKRAISSEWFNVFVFLLMVLTAVLWSATSSAHNSEYQLSEFEYAIAHGKERELENRIKRLEDTARILSKFHYDAALRATGMDALASPALKRAAVELACGEKGCETPEYLEAPKVAK